MTSPGARDVIAAVGRGQGQSQVQGQGQGQSRRRVNGTPQTEVGPEAKRRRAAVSVTSSQREYHSRYTGDRVRSGLRSKRTVYYISQQGGDF